VSINRGSSRVSSGTRFLFLPAITDDMVGREPIRHRAEAEPGQRDVVEAHSDAPDFGAAAAGRAVALGAGGAPRKRPRRSQGTDPDRFLAGGAAQAFEPDDVSATAATDGAAPTGSPPHIIARERPRSSNRALRHAWAGRPGAECPPARRAACDAAISPEPRGSRGDRRARSIMTEGAGNQPGARAGGVAVGGPNSGDVRPT
jgi:hypothetical protein